MPSTSTKTGVIELPFNEHLVSSNPSLELLRNYLLPILLKKLKLKRVSKSYRVVMEILILNFFIIHKADKNKIGNVQLGLPMQSKHYTKGQRFNQNNKITYTVLKNLKEMLEDLKYIRQVSPHYHGELVGKTRTFVPTAKFYKLMDTFRLRIGSIGIDTETYQTVRMRDVKPKRIKGQKTRPRGKLINYDPTPEIIDWISQVQTFNQQASYRHINIYVTDKEMITIRKKLSKDNEREEQFKYIPFHNKFLYRVFNNRKWDNGGRFYGAFWQAIPSGFRHRITIDNHITTEKDYTAIHYYLLYDEMKADYPEKLVHQGFFDPYDLLNYNPQWKQEDVQKHRKTTKLAMNFMLNAETEEQGIQACADKLRGKLPEGYSTWKDYVNHIREVHSSISHAFLSGKGIEYQFKDSQVALRVLEIMANEHGQLAIPIHDSFIVRVKDENLLEQAMQKATKEILGISIPMTIASQAKKIEWSETNYLPVTEVNPEECSGYFERLKEWNEGYPMETTQTIPNFEQALKPIRKTDLRLVDRIFLSEEDIKIQRQQLIEGIENEEDPYEWLNRNQHMADPDAL